jgi:hypothetical protein
MIEDDEDDDVDQVDVVDEVDGRVTRTPHGQGASTYVQ